MLDLNSIRFKSFVVGLAGDLPNTVNKSAASKLRNEFILVRTRILVKYHHYSLIVPVAEKVFVIPAKAGIQFFTLDPCFRRGDIFDFRFPQQ